MAVALTFDTEHPGHPTEPGTEERILATLAEAGIRATFFLQGRWVSAYPELARRIAAADHAIGNHSHHHAAMDGLTDEYLREDVRDAEEAIRAATGIDPKPLFRCPFGSGMDDPRVLAALEELGYRNVGWDVDPKDWAEERTAHELVAAVVEGVAAIDGDAIVLLHGWPAVTAETLPRVIAGLRENGAELVTVNEL